MWRLETVAARAHLSRRALARQPRSLGRREYAALPDTALVIASFFSGVSGALFAHYVGTINPNLFDVEQMVFVLTWAIVGGTATIYGPVLGVALLTILNEVVLREMGFEQARPLIYGAILIAFVLFLPRGLESLVLDARRWWSRGTFLQC